MLTAIALSVTALFNQPLFDDLEAQKTAMLEAGIAQDQEPVAARVVGQDLQELRGSVSRKFESATTAEVLQWLSDQGINFVVRDQEIANTRLTLNFDNTPKREVLRAIGIALGGRWRREGNTYVFVKGAQGLAVPGEEGMRFMPGEFKMDMKELPMMKLDGKDFNFAMPREGMNFKWEEKDMKVLQDHLKQMETFKTKDGKTFQYHGDGEKMTPEQKAKFEKHMKEFGEKMRVFGEGMGKDMKVFGKMHEMSPEDQAKFEKHMKEFGGNMRVFGEGMGDMKVFGKMHEMSPEDQAKFEKHMKDMPKMQEHMFRTKDGKDLKVFGDLKEMSPQQRAKFELKMKDLEKNMMALPKMREHMFKSKDGQQVRVYGDFKEMSPEEQKKFEMRMKEFGEKMEVWGEGFGKDFKFDGPDVFIAHPDMKGLSKADMQKLEKGTRARTFVAPRAGAPGRFRVMEESNIRGLLHSLTPSQKERMNRQGYLTPSDLTQNQLRMLGDLPAKGDWTISYSMDGDKVTIKGKG